jgi:hypothetical protein
MTNVIKVKFLRNGKPSGRAYTYYTPEEVAVGDIVELNSRDGIAKGVVTQVDVPEEEILVFGDGAKSIIGKAPEDSPTVAGPAKRFDIQKDINEALEDIDAS